MVYSNDKGKKMRCQIIREGIVNRIEHTLVSLNIEGKTIEVPKAKVDSTVIVGDVVRWIGDKWVRI